MRKAKMLPRRRRIAKKAACSYLPHRSTESNIGLISSHSIVERLGPEVLIPSASYSSRNLGLAGTLPANFGVISKFCGPFESNKGREP